MRRLVPLLISLVLAFAGAFAYGWFGLAPGLTIERSIEVNRPRAAAFAVAQNLETLPDWAPWLVGAVGARFEAEGMPGKDQRARWSNATDLVAGEQWITQVKENAEVVAQFVSERGSATMRLRFIPNGASTHTEWESMSECGASPLSVPCRYRLHFLTRPAQEQRSEQALANLKAVIEALPNVDFERLDPQFVQVSPATYAFVESEVAFEAKAVALAEAQSFESVRAYLSANALPLSAPQVLFTVRQITVRQNEERMNFRAGYVVPGDNAPIPGADSPVRLDATPSGLAMKVVLDGPRDGLRQTYGMIAAYLQAHRLKPAAGPWEVRFPALPGADTKQTRTEIYYLLR